MEALKIKVIGLSEEQVRKDIERMTKGWHLFFEEPTGVEYHFLKPFWGFSWNGTPENLRDIIVKGTEVQGRNKQHLCIFKFNGEDKFVWCSWEKVLYDYNTGIKHPLEPKYAYAITTLIKKLS